jgi:hypothetical protein
MDLNLKALIGIVYLIPIAITLKKIYAPMCDVPESISLVLVKLKSVQPGAQDSRSEDHDPLI